MCAFGLFCHSAPVAGVSAEDREGDGMSEQEVLKQVCEALAGCTDPEPGRYPGCRGILYRRPYWRTARLLVWVLVLLLAMLLAVLAGCARPPEYMRVRTITVDVGDVTVTHEFIERTPDRPADWDDPDVRVPGSRRPGILKTGKASRLQTAGGRQ